MLGLQVYATMTLLKSRSSKAQTDERASHSHLNARDDLGFELDSLLLRSPGFLPVALTAFFLEHWTALLDAQDEFSFPSMPDPSTTFNLILSKEVS